MQKLIFRPFVRKMLEQTTLFFFAQDFLQNEL